MPLICKCNHLGSFSSALSIFVSCSPSFLVLPSTNLRDFFDWLYRKPQRSRLLGLGIALYGVLLTVTALAD